MGSTRQDLDRLVGDFVAAIADHTVTFAEMGQLASDVTAVVLDLSDIKTDPQDEDDIVAFLMSAYDRYITPIDIPRVPDRIESWVDSIAKAALATGVHDAFTRLRAA